MKFLMNLKATQGFSLLFTLNAVMFKDVCKTNALVS